MRQLAKIDMVHVPFKGVPEAVTAVIRGDVQFYFAPIPSAQSQSKAGKVRALAINSAKRAPQMPEIPTVTEAGVRGYSTSSWYGLLAPAGTPKPVVDRLSAAANKAVTGQDLRTRLLTDGAEPVGSNPAAFQKHLAAEMDKWRKVVKAAHVTAE